MPLFWDDSTGGYLRLFGTEFEAYIGLKVQIEEYTLYGWMKIIFKDDILYIDKYAYSKNYLECILAGKLESIINC